MTDSVFVRIHPDEVALGAALIAAAAAAVRLPLGKMVVAWECTHTQLPVDPTDLAVRQMLEAAGQRVGGCDCFRFRMAPEPRIPGPLVPLVAKSHPPARVRFEPAVRALARSVRVDGAFGVVVSTGLPSYQEPEATVCSRPGILRISPGWPGDDEFRLDDVFAVAGFPTLHVTEDVAFGARSAHEGLELCAWLGDRMAQGVEALRRPRSRRPKPAETAPAASPPRT